MPVAIAVALFVFIAIGVGGVVYYNARDREKGPPRFDWFNQWVVYGTCQWDLSRMPASHLVVRLFGRRAFGGTSKLAEWVTGVDGWYECVTNQYDSDVFLRVSLLLANGTEQLLLDDQDTQIDINTPHRRDFVLISPEQLLSTRPTSSWTGTVTVSGSAIFPEVAVVDDLGARTIVAGSLTPELRNLSLARVEIRGALQGLSAYGESVVAVGEYVIIGIPAGIPLVRGQLTVDNAVWTAGSNVATSLTSATPVLTDGRERITLSANAGTTRRFLQKITYPAGGPKMWARGGLNNGTLSVTSYGFLT
jgi:hypothetical protein